MPHPSKHIPFFFLSLLLFLPPLPFLPLLLLGQQLSVNPASQLSSELLLEDDGCLSQEQKSLPHEEGSVVLLYRHHTAEDLSILFPANEMGRADDEALSYSDELTLG